MDLRVVSDVRQLHELKETLQSLGRGFWGLTTPGETFTKLGKERIIAETGAGQHGVATATVCARLGLKCFIYMGAKDMERQSLNVFRMRLLGRL